MSDSIIVIHCTLLYEFDHQLYFPGGDKLLIILLFGLPFIGYRLILEFLELLLLSIVRMLMQLLRQCLWRSSLSFQKDLDQVLLRL